MEVFPSEQWIDRFRQAANADPELSVIGDFFTVDFALAFGDERYVIEVKNGRVANIIHNPRFDRATKFGMRAPMDLWKRFFSESPPPLYHDIFAMIMRVPEFVLDGDTLVAMQNARALRRLMAVMQEEGGQRDQV